MYLSILKPVSTSFVEDEFVGKASDIQALNSFNELFKIFIVHAPTEAF